MLGVLSPCDFKPCYNCFLKSCLQLIQSTLKFPQKQWASSSDWLAVLGEWSVDPIVEEQESEQKQKKTPAQYTPSPPPPPNPTKTNKKFFKRRKKERKKILIGKADQNDYKIPSSVTSCSPYYFIALWGRLPGLARKSPAAEPFRKRLLLSEGHRSQVYSCMTAVTKWEPELTD